MIQINAAARQPLTMADGTTFQNRSGRNRLRALFIFWRQYEGRDRQLWIGCDMKNIVDEEGEIIAKATDDHTLVGGHHRLAVAASLGQKLFWKDTGEPVHLDPFFKGSSHRHTA
jgi:hypothetical protein